MSDSATSSGSNRRNSSVGPGTRTDTDTLAPKAKLARIRDNQRRSRKRRREYLQELEEKYRECERAGVEASALVQAAARKVLDENRRLRALLKSRGVSDAEIDEVALEEREPQVVSSSTTTIQLETTLNTRRPCCPETKFESTPLPEQSERQARQTPGLTASFVADNTQRLSPLCMSSSSSQSFRQRTISPAITHPSPGYPQPTPTYLDPITSTNNTLPHDALHLDPLSLHEGWSSYATPFDHTSDSGHISTRTTIPQGVNTTGGHGVNLDLAYDDSGMFDGLVRFPNGTLNSRWE
jgi:hypothetical protein